MDDVLLGVAVPHGTGWTVNSWMCRCHPTATWGQFADYERCPYSDLNYTQSNVTYGESHATYADLAAAHDLVPVSVDNVSALIAEVLNHD